MVVGLILLVLMLAVGWYWHVAPSRNIRVSFLGFKRSPDLGWTADFCLSNSTWSRVYCHPSLRGPSGNWLVDPQDFRTSRTVELHSGQIWSFQVPDTNSSYILQFGCMEPWSPLKSRINEIIEQLNDKYPDLHLSLLNHRGYAVTCSTEAR